MVKKDMQWGIIIALVFALVVSLFALANMDHTTVSFLVWEASVPLVIVILLSTLAGALIIASFSFANQISNTHKVKRIQKQLEELEKELAEQKNLVAESKKDLDKQTAANIQNNQTNSSLNNEQSSNENPEKAEASENSEKLESYNSPGSKSSAN